MVDTPSQDSDEDKKFSTPQKNSRDDVSTSGSESETEVFTTPPSSAEGVVSKSDNELGVEQVVSTKAVSPMSPNKRKSNDAAVELNSLPPSNEDAMNEKIAAPTNAVSLEKTSLFDRAMSFIEWVMKMFLCIVIFVVILAFVATAVVKDDDSE